MSRRRIQRRERGVTLLEMLVVVSIIAVLVGISYPSITGGLDSIRLATAADSVAAFLNAAADRAERKHVVVEVSINKRRGELELRTPEPNSLRKMKLPDGITIREILPRLTPAEEDARNIYLYPGGAVPRVGVELVTKKGARRVVRIDPITGAPEIQR